MLECAGKALHVSNDILERIISAAAHPASAWMSDEGLAEETVDTYESFTEEEWQLLSHSSVPVEQVLA